MTPQDALPSGLWEEATGRLRAMERRLLGLWEGAGYVEVIPPLLLPGSAARRATPGALAPSALRVPAGGEEDLALRADFTASVAWMVAGRPGAVKEPLRLCYAGTVVRRPPGDRNAEPEIFQAGCERIEPPGSDCGDEELVLLAARTLRALDIGGAVLELGHWGIVGPLLERIPWPAEARAPLEGALNRKSLHQLRTLVERYGACPESGLLGDLLHLGAGAPDAPDLGPRLEEAGVSRAWEHLRYLATRVAREVPGIPVRLEAADVRRWSYYTGLTVKAFTPSHPYAVLSGGRYDALLPSLGRPCGACGFAVHTGRILKGG